MVRFWRELFVFLVTQRVVFKPSSLCSFHGRELSNKCQQLFRNRRQRLHVVNQRQAILSPRTNIYLNTFSYNQICLIIGYSSVQSAHEATLSLAQAFVFEAVVDVVILNIKTFRFAMSRRIISKFSISLATDPFQGPSQVRRRNTGHNRFRPQQLLPATAFSRPFRPDCQAS